MSLAPPAAGAPATPPAASPAGGPPASAPAAAPGAAPATPPTATAEQKADSARFAGLARQQQELTKQQQALKAERAQHAADLQAAKDHAELRELMAKDPLKALEKLGGSYDALTKARLAAAGATSGGVTKEELAAFRKELLDRETQKQTAAEQAEAKRRQADEAAFMDRHRSEIGEHLTAGGDAYELTSAFYGLTGAPDPASFVLEIIQGHWDQHQKVLTIKEAADLAEKHFEEDLLAKMRGTKKYASVTQPASVKPKTEAPPAPKPNEQPKSISELSASSGGRPPARSGSKDDVSDMVAKYNERMAAKAKP